MPMLNFMPLLTPYSTSLLRLLKALEGPHAVPKDVSDKDITIGLGFNLNKNERVRGAVVDYLLGAATGPGTPSQGQIDLENLYRDFLFETIVDPTKRGWGQALRLNPRSGRQRQRIAIAVRTASP